MSRRLFPFSSGALRETHRLSPTHHPLSSFFPSPFFVFLALIQFSLLNFHLSQASTNSISNLTFQSSSSKPTTIYVRTFKPTPTIWFPTFTTNATNPNSATATTDDEIWKFQFFSRRRRTISTSTILSSNPTSTSSWASTTAFTFTYSNDEFEHEFWRRSRFTISNCSRY